MWKAATRRKGVAQDQNAYKNPNRTVDVLHYQDKQTGSSLGRYGKSNNNNKRKKNKVVNEPENPVNNETSDKLAVAELG